MEIIVDPYLKQMDEREIIFVQELYSVKYVHIVHLNNLIKIKSLDCIPPFIERLFWLNCSNPWRKVK